MKAIILDYCTTCIEVVRIPNNLISEDGSAETAENVENYLSLELGFHLDSINYMTADDDEPIPVYVNGTEEPEITF